LTFGSSLWMHTLLVWQVKRTVLLG
jgi:hypothetical protein